MPSVENPRDTIAWIITQHPRAILILTLVVLAGCGDPDGGGGY
jgi:hypothetical protein